MVPDKMITHPLRILLLEDSPEDAGLIEWHLKSGKFPFEIHVAECREKYSQALDTYRPDIILSDHSLPSFNSMEALQMVRERGLIIPFILVTATVSEEFAVDILKQGAWDYILKDRMQRLPLAVINAYNKYIADQEQKRTEDMLRKSQANLSTILDNSETGYILTDPSLNVMSFNEKAVQMAQYQFNKPLLAGTYAIDYFPDERKPYIKSVMRKAMQGKRIGYEISYPQPDGSFKWFDILYTGIKDGDNKTLGVIMSITDINENKLAALERDRIAGDLIKRNNALEQFTYVVSHNLRAPVSNILGISYLFRDSELTKAEIIEFHEALARATENLDKIVIDLNEILQVTQHESEPETEVSFQEIVNDIQSGIHAIVEKEHTKIKCDFSKIAGMHAVRNQLYSIFYNLIINGIKFRKQDVSPVVSIKSWKKKDQLYLDFKDNGQGIDLEKYGADLFSLYGGFNQTEGRGMGLFMVKIQVDMLNGHITVKSTPGIGTEFLISFPLKE